MQENCTGIILAGGKSSRFGKDKTKIRLNGKLMIEKQAEILKNQLKEIIIVSNEKDKFGLPNTLEVSDFYKNVGPMGGIHAGLCYASYETCLIFACDMPFLNEGFVKKLLQISKEAPNTQMIIPISNRGIEPLCGVYKKCCLHSLEKSIKAEEKKLTAWIEKRYIEGLAVYFSANKEEMNCFYNINTEEDYKRIKKN